MTCFQNCYLQFWKQHIFFKIVNCNFGNNFGNNFGMNDRYQNCCVQIRKTIYNYQNLFQNGYDNFGNDFEKTKIVANITILTKEDKKDHCQNC